MIGSPAQLQKFRDEVIQSTGTFPENFIATFEVKSIERTGFSNKMVDFRALPGDYLTVVSKHHRNESDAN